LEPFWETRQSQKLLLRRARIERIVMGIQTALDASNAAIRIVDIMRAADDLAFMANRNPGLRTVRVLAATLNGSDQISAISAVHALGQVADDDADGLLSELLSSDRLFLREHAAWALGSRLPRLDAEARLLGLIVGGGFAGMLAQRTIQAWGIPAPEHMAVGIEGALLGITKAGARARLVETMSLIPGRTASRALEMFASDTSEHISVRVAAITGLGDRPAISSALDLVTELAAGDDYLATAAKLALVDLTAVPTPRMSQHTGLTVAQMFLHADIDPQLTRSGSGDNGGIATLLVRLGDSLAAQFRDGAESALTGIVQSATQAQSIERVITMSRGSVVDAYASLQRVAAVDRGHAYATVPLLTDPVASADAWPLRVAAERGIRRVLRAAGNVDVMHLRMADVGSLAAANVARDLDIPVVFTVAPDPHGVINSLDLAGELSRENFGEIDQKEHFWFRARLVQRLAADAAHTVLFPRPELERDMKVLVGIDISAHAERHSIVPEGIDLAVIDTSVAEAAAYAAGAEATPALAELASLIEKLPESRRSLPLFVSVGRLHRVKGMAMLVNAWAGSEVSERANLLIIGGDLKKPSADEREQLARMDMTIPPAARTNRGLILAGHQPNDTVARWVAAARFGMPGLNAPGGVYVCASIKEEFGIAILEGMAAGLMVVAPVGGGPATYIENGVTGILSPTHDARLLGLSLAKALDLVATEKGNERPDRSRAVVETDFTIGAMATTLSDIYAHVHEADEKFAATIGEIR
jgi:glycosyltransferase involved in cell wall biosynthesis